VPLWYAPIGAIGPLLLDRPVGGGDFLAWLWVAVCGELTLLVCFPLARRLVHARRESGGTPQARRSADQATDRATRPVATLLALLMAAVLRGLVVALMAQPLITTSLAAELSYRLTAALLLQLGFLILIALLQNDRDDHRALVATLRERERQLIELDATAAERLAVMHRQLVDEVQASIDPELDRLLQGLDGRSARADTAASVQQITELIEHQVRPIGRRLAFTTIGEVPIPAVASPYQTSRTPLPRRLAVVDCLLTWPSVWVVFVASIIGAMRNAAGGQQVTFILGMTGTTMLGLLLARRAAIRWAPPTAVTIAVVMGLNCALPTLALWVMYREGITGSNAVVTAAAVGAAIGAFSAGYGAVNQGRLQAEQELQAAVVRLESSVNVLRQKAWVIRRQLGYFMHGALQGSLFAAAMRLASAESADDRAVESILLDVRRTLARLESATCADVDIEAALEDLTTLWSGTCEVDVELGEGERVELVARPETAACTAELIREGIGNAVRHGEATGVRVAIQSADGMLRIEVIDDGPRWSGQGTPGLGSRMRDEMCLDWSLDRQDERTFLRAILAL